MPAPAPSLLSAKPAADPALGLGSLLLDALVEGINLLHRVSLGLLSICLHLSFRFSELRAGSLGLWIGFILVCCFAGLENFVIRGKWEEDDRRKAGEGCI
jgi:hypothetical protein